MKWARRPGWESSLRTLTTWALFPLVAASAVYRLLNREIPALSLWDMVGGATLVFALLMGLVLLITQLKRTMRSPVSMVALLLLAALLLDPGWLYSASNHIFYSRREHQLSEFVKEIEAYGSIHSMSDGERAHKELNGRLITYEVTQEELRGAGPPLVYFRRVLEEDMVDLDTYETFRSRLINLGLMSFDTTEDYIGFTIDGFLNRCYGLLFSRTGAELRRIAFQAYTGCGTIRQLDRLNDRWYFYET